MTDLKTYTYGPASGGVVRQLVVLLHGLGADGRDLLGLAPHFAQVLPDAVFVSPDAPFPCDMAPMGRQWFSLQSWTPQAILKGVQTASPILADFISAQSRTYNVPYSKIALVGFSQGTMMSLYTGPRLTEQVAGIVGYSGALVWENDVDPGTLKKPPVLLIHGMADTVVPVTAYYHAKESLERAGFSVTGRVSPTLMHAIDEAGLQAASNFLTSTLAGA